MSAEPMKVRRLKSVERIGRVADDYYENLRRAPEEGRKVVWAGGFPTSFPFFRAMDIAYLFEDVYAATAAARHKEGKLQQITANKGYLPEMCSYARTTLGLAYFPEAEKEAADPYYLMPSPDFFVFVDIGCSMLPNWSDAGRRHFGKPMFGVSVPYVRTWNEEQEAIHEVARQFQEMTVFLEDMTGKPFDWVRLREIMVNVKQTVDLRMNAMAIAGRAVPSPATFFDWAAAVGAVSYAIGTPLGLELIKDIHADVTDLVSRGVSALPDEQVRVYWMGHMCWPYMRWWGETLGDLGINIVAANYSHMGFFHRPELIDPDKPLESLAANSVMCLSLGIEPLAEQIMQQCRDYSLDAIVCHDTQTCRVFPGPYFEVMDIIQRKLGIPGIFFEGDVADANYFSTEQARTRIEALKESVLSRKAAAGSR